MSTGLGGGLGGGAGALVGATAASNNGADGGGAAADGGGDSDLSSLITNFHATIATSSSCLTLATHIASSGAAREVVANNGCTQKLLEILNDDSSDFAQYDASFVNLRSAQLKLLRNSLAGPAAAVEAALAANAPSRLLYLAQCFAANQNNELLTQTVQILANLVQGPAKHDILFPTKEEHQTACQRCEHAVFEAISQDWEAVENIALACASLPRAHTALCVILSTSTSSSAAHTHELLQRLKLVTTLVVSSISLWPSLVRNDLDDNDDENGKSVPEKPPDIGWDVMHAQTKLADMVNSAWMHCRDEFSNLLMWMGMCDDDVPNRSLRMRAQTYIMNILAFTLSRDLRESTNGGSRPNIPAGEGITSHTHSSGLPSNFEFEVVSLVRESSSLCACSSDPEVDASTASLLLCMCLRILRLTLEPPFRASDKPNRDLLRVVVNLLSTLGPVTPVRQHAVYTIKANPRGSPMRAPRSAPYKGYRTDLLAIMANLICAYPDGVTDALQIGGVKLIKLLLSQTSIDPMAPMAREWAIVCIGKLCEMPEAQSVISDLEWKGVDEQALREAGLGQLTESLVAKLSAKHKQESQ